jgi:fructokinase
MNRDAAFLSDSPGCIVIGDIFYDISIKIDESFLRFNLGGTYYPPTIRMFAGGSGNVATALAILGMKSTFIGKAGNDQLGQLYIRDLKKRKVLPYVYFDKHYPTGIVINLVHPNGQRSFIVSRGANDTLQISEIEALRNLLRENLYVYVTGYSLVRSPQRETIIRAAEIAKEHDKIVVFDPGAFNIIRNERSSFHRLLQLTEILCPNAQEAMELTGIRNVYTAIKRLTDLVPLVIVKLGNEGAIISCNNDQNLLKIPVCKTVCVDTTGAGDAFVGAVIFGHSLRMPLEHIGRFANWFAAKKVEKLGGRSFPSQKQIIDFLRNVLEYE